MIDSKKRTTLKAISGVTAASVIPATVSAASALFAGEDTKLPVSANGHDISVSMGTGHGRWHSVMLTNTSNKAVSVQHIYPGLVSVGNKKYDVNSLFQQGAIVIQPGESHSGVVAMKTATSLETELPNGLTRKNSFELASSYQHFGKTMPVVTTRSFFA